MSLGQCAYKTFRLSVDEWHSAKRSVDGANELPATVASMLTEAVTKNLPPGWQGEFDEHRAETWITERDAEGTVLLAVQRTGDVPVGLLILFEDSSQPVARVHVGYIVAERMWGAGYATEMLAGFVDWCRSNITGTELIAGVDISNAPSVKVLEKCGFEREEGAEPGNDSAFFNLTV